MHIKVLKKSEYEKLLAVRDVPELKKAALPFILFRDIEIMPSGLRLHSNERPDLRLLIPKLKKIYELRVKTYSEGIYSFARCGINRRGENPYYYRYLAKEIDSLIESVSVPTDLQESFDICLKMWNRDIAKYKDKYFYRYEILHGDLHEGNMLYWMNNIYLIDWEYLRSGPKEMELSFFLCWHYLQKTNRYTDFQLLEDELQIMIKESLIDRELYAMIKNMLIPMWFLVDICYLSKGLLAFSEERKKQLVKMLPLYVSYLNNGK